MTRQEYLDKLIDELKKWQHGNLSIEYRPFTGWVLCGEARYRGDDGEDFAGRNWREAEKFLRWFLGNA